MPEDAQASEVEVDDSLSDLAGDEDHEKDEEEEKEIEVQAKNVKEATVSNSEGSKEAKRKLLEVDRGFTVIKKSVGKKQKRR
jgi:hypothetical protein